MCFFFHSEDAFSFSKKAPNCSRRTLEDAEISVVNYPTFSRLPAYNCDPPNIQSIFEIRFVKST